MEEIDNTYKEKYETVRTNLFSGGGLYQARDFLYNIMDETSPVGTSLNAATVLQDISKMIESYVRIIKYGSFVKVDRCFSLVDKQTYPCLTNDMQFVLRKYGTSEWEDVEFVMPYLDVNRANDIINHEYEDLFKRK